MKKRLITILSLIMAFVLCFSLVACGGDNTPPNKKPSGGGEEGEPKPQPGTAVSITLNDAIGALDGVFGAPGFKGSAAYTLSTKNTDKLTESVAYEKRGDKLKLTVGTDERIVDLKTGYVYNKGANGYTFEHEFCANEIDYVLYALSSLPDEVKAQNYPAVYNKDDKTVTIVIDKAEDVNKYLTPLYSAYANEKIVGYMLDDYSKLLFGKKFDEAYGVAVEYIKNPKNTLGTVMDLIKAKSGIDVEAALGMFMEEDFIKVVKARKLNEVVAGLYEFATDFLKDFLPMSADEESTDDDIDTPDDSELGSSVGGGMMTIGMQLAEKALFTEYTKEDIATSLAGIDMLLGVAKTFPVKELVDMLAENAEFAELHTAIKDGVKLEKATITVTLNVDDNQRIMGVKVDCFASHTYKGEAIEDGFFLSDNDYHATAELKIDEYTASPAEFNIAFDPACNYKMPVAAYLYEVTDDDVLVYFETAGNTVNITDYSLYIVTPDDEWTPIVAPEGAVTFDAATSSFVFDGEFVQSVFGDEALSDKLQAGISVFNTTLHAMVTFDGDEDRSYGISLVYVNNDPEEVYGYLRDSAIEMIKGFMGDMMPGAPGDENVSMS